MRITEFASPDPPRRNAAPNRIRRQILYHDRVGADRNTVGDCDWAKYFRAAGNGDIVSDHRRFGIILVPNAHLLIDPAILTDRLCGNIRAESVLNIQPPRQCPVL